MRRASVRMASVSGALAPCPRRAWTSARAAIVRYHSDYVKPLELGGALFMCVCLS